TLSRTLSQRNTPSRRDTIPAPGAPSTAATGVRFLSVIAALSAFCLLLFLCRLDLPPVSVCVLARSNNCLRIRQTGAQAFARPKPSMAQRVVNFLTARGGRKEPLPAVGGGAPPNEGLEPAAAAAAGPSRSGLPAPAAG